MSVFFCILLACARSGSVPPAQDPQPRYLPRTTPGQDDYPRAGAVILLDEGTQNIYSRNERVLSVLDRHTAIKILNERGYTYANVTIPYEAGSRITNIRARTILPDGGIVTLDPGQIFDTNYNSEYIYYSDQRMKRFTMPAVESGCIVEYSWQKRCDNIYAANQWPFQREDPVLLSRYSLVTPRNWPLQYRSYGKSAAPVFSRTPRGDRMEYAWQAVNMPPFIPELSAPPGDRIRSHLLFSPFGMETWQDVADWYLNLAEDTMQPERSIQEITQTIVGEASSRFEKLRAIFNFVQATIRYINIEIGIGGYRPHSAESVLRNRFGDCKDMVSLLAAIAGAADITVHPVLLSTWPHGEADTSLVTPHYFNHVIAVSFLENGEPVWMDPTEKKVSFGRLPWYDQGRRALAAHRRGSAAIMTTPREGAEANRSTRHWNITLDGRGRASGTITIEFEGSQAMEMRHQLQRIHPDNRASWLIRDVFSYYPVTIESKVHVAHENTISRPLIISASFSSSYIVLKSQSLFTLFPDALSTFSWHKLFPGTERRDDVVMKHPLSVVDRIHINHPAGWSLVSDKQSDAIQTEFGSFSWQLSLHGPGTALFDRTFTLDTVRVPLEKFPDFRTFLFNTALSDQTLILFSDTPDN